jgi:hypothetical protein
VKLAALGGGAKIMAVGFTASGAAITKTTIAVKASTVALGALKAAMLAVPWAIAIAGAIAAANATYQAFAAWIDFNRVLNQAPLDEVTQKIKTLEGRLVEAENKTVTWYEAILDFILGVDGASTAVAGLTARIDELNQRKIQITDLRPEQGADLDMEEIRRLSNTYNPPKITTPTVVSGGGGGGGGGGAAPRESEIPALTRELELSDKLLQIDRQRLEAQFQGNTARIQELSELRVLTELEGKKAEIAAEAIPEAEQKLKIQLAENEAALAGLELKYQGLEAEKQRKEALEGILSPLNEEIELLQARLNGNEKEIKQKQEIARLQKEITGQGGDPAQAAGLIKTRDALIELNKQQDKAKAQAEELAGAIANSLTSSLRGLIDGSKSAEEALSDAFKGIADAFLDMAMKMIQEWIKMQVIGLVSGLFTGGAGGGGLASFGGGTPLGALSGSMPFTGFAEGGYVTSPTQAVIGEGGQSEYVIPESKMNDAMHRWNSGTRGGDVINGASSDASLGSDGRYTAGPTNVIVNGGITQMGGNDYIRKDEVPSIVAQASKQGEARAIRRLQMSPGTRRKLGM